MSAFTKMATRIIQLFVFLELASLCYSTPITSPQPRSIRLRSNIDHLDLLVPDSNGTLVRANAAQRREALQVRQEPEPGQITNIGNGQCKYAKVINDIAHPACSLFCNIQSVIVDGTPQTVSGDINCAGVSCSTAYAYTTTITESFSVNAGITVEYAKSGIKGQATLGYSHTWSTAIGTTNTYTFNPASGDKGHVVFVPYMEEVCGTLTIFENSGEYYECLDWSKHADGVNQNHVLQYDPMSCGQTPIKLPDGSAHGVYSFCNTNTKVGCP